MPPTRCCIACRRKASPGELLRLVAGVDGEVLLDSSGGLPGRGAWLHPQRDCLRKVLKRPATLSRALRMAVRLDGFEDRLHRASLQRVGAALGRASRSGCVVSGRVAILRDLQRGELEALMAAHDAAPRSIESLTMAVAGLPVFDIEFDRETLGKWVGKGPRAALGLRRGEPIETLLTELRRYTSLGYHPRRNRSGDRPEATRRAGMTQSRGCGPGSPSSLVSSRRMRGQPTVASFREGNECPRKNS